MEDDDEEEDDQDLPCLLWSLVENKKCKLQIDSYAYKFAA